MYDMKLPNFTSLVCGLVEHKKNNSHFLLLNLDNNRYGHKENFAKICQIK